MNFNDVLKSFLEELSHVFPEEASIAGFAAGFDALVEANFTMPRTMFREAMAPHARLLATRDEAMFSQLRFPGGIDFAKLWASNLTDATRKAIWEYLNMLFAMTEVGTGAGGGAGIESMAMEAAMRCAEKMKAEGTDPSTLMRTVLRDVPEDVTRSIQSLADECATKLKSGEASMEDVIADLVGRIETMDLQGLENADMTALSRAMGLPDGPAGLLGAMTSAVGEEDDLLKMLSEPAKDLKKKKKKKK